MALIFSILLYNYFSISVSLLSCGTTWGLCLNHFLISPGTAQYLLNSSTPGMTLKVKKAERTEQKCVDTHFTKEWWPGEAEVVTLLPRVSWVELADSRRLRHLINGRIMEALPSGTSRCYWGWGDDPQWYSNSQDSYFTKSILEQTEAGNRKCPHLAVCSQLWAKTPLLVKGEKNTEGQL